MLAKSHHTSRSSMACLVPHASSPVLEFMKKLAAGMEVCIRNWIPVSAVDQWASIAEAWQAAGKPLPSEFEHVSCPEGSECMAERYVSQCLQLQKS